MADVHLEPWGTDDLPLLERCLADPVMTEHLGGPETAERIARRQARYEQPDSKQFKIVDDESGEGVGWVGYWDRDVEAGKVYEIGWAVVPEFQGRGIASAATRLALDRARAEGTHRYVHAYPSVDNAASNAIPRKLGFELLGAFDFEYPPGTPLTCNDWRYDLEAG